MRGRHSIRLLGLSGPLLLPLLLMQALPSSCLPSPGGGGQPGFNLPPTVNLTSDVTSGVAPLTVFFSSSGSSDDGVIVQRLWDFGDGVGTSQEISPTYTYQTTGVYTVTLTLVDDQGARSSDTLKISVTQRPVAIIEVDRTVAASAPAVFKFDGSKSYDPDAKTGETLRYRWDFGDGSRELLAQVDHTFASPGTYRVRLTVTDALGVIGTAEVVILVGIPRPQITIRTPPEDITNIVCTNARTSSLWVHAVPTVAPGVPYRLRAGLDGDRDACNALIALYDPQTGEEQARLEDATGNEDLRQRAVRAAVFHPDPDSGRLLAGGDDGRVRLYDTLSGAVLRRYTGSGSAVKSLAFFPDGARFVVGYADGTVQVRETGSNAIVRALVGHADAVNAVAVSPDGNLVLSGDAAGIAILWSASSGAELLRYDHGGAAVNAVAFSPSNPQRLLTASSDATARLWSTVNGNMTQEFAPVYVGGELVAGHSKAITSAAFSTDGTLVATGSEDKTVILWNAELGSQMRAFKSHTAAVRGVALSPDGTQLLSGGDDGTAIVWNVQSGQAARTLKPCRSGITAVGFAADGRSVLAAVAARNDFQLDTEPTSGNDLNLTMPTPLRLKTEKYEVAPGQYYLWVEVQTDRTAPVRSYAKARVNVMTEFPSTISGDVPVIPLRNDAANVVTAASGQRQIFDLGELDVGDRVYLSLLTIPGYGTAYALEDFSVMILDAEQKLFAWYERKSAMPSDTVLFSPATKLIVGHYSPSYYVVLDSHDSSVPVPSVNIRIEREFAADSQPRQQYVYLNFNTSVVRNLAVAGSSQFNLAPFDTAVGAAGYDVTAVKLAVVARLQALFGAYNFVVSTSPPASDVTPRLTVYFDTTNALLAARLTDRNNNNITDAGDLVFYGLTDYIDARNMTLSGKAVIAVGQIMADFPGLADGELGTAIGNAAAHHIGLLCGLRETTQSLATDVMINDETEVTNAALTFTTAALAPSGDLDAIGIQDADLLLGEIFGIP